MQISNSIAWAHLQLKGGWRNILTTSVTYFVILLVVIFASVRLADPTPPAQVLGGWVFILMGLQIGTLVLFGCWAISAAIRKDVTSKIIESHRLMPVSGADAVAGYILGPASQAIAFSCVNLVLGLVLSRFSSFGGTQGWLYANLVLGVFAACAWIVMVFLPLVLPVSSRLLIGLIWVIFVGYETIPALLPGVSFLFGPALSGSVFDIITTGQVAEGQILSMLGQILVAVLCYVGAVRKYRRDDLLAWGPGVGLAVVAAYVVIQLAGLALWDVIKPWAWRTSRISFEVQLLIAATGALLIGLIPVHGAAWLHASWERRRALNDPALNRRPIAVGVVVLIAAVIIAALPALAVPARWHVVSNAPVVRGQPISIHEPLTGPDVPLEAIVRTGLVAAAFLLSVSYLLRWLYRREIRTRWLVVFFVLLTWAGPPMLDFMVEGMRTGFESDDVLTTRAGCSPLVAMVWLWTSSGLSTNPGIAVQWLIAGVMGAVYHFGGKKTAVR
ncbi:MAG TPA: hypothetical protein PKG54_11270 [Phycisphaerae bacterium]|jgi:hypothetical protein|nr:hypothetical protein [Phycisphaerae bacterium]HOJ53186.1 hypothetical protein [Phycisphaerae bacterium]HOL25150.1 hypothetical protein [Phycisphaerae bacterium]HPP20296.1 hypothetical protein [Phycisphaerae bacterium]HPU32353.1 hypothetical protein [Phycisphaerae bacterium]